MAEAVARAAERARRRGAPRADAARRPRRGRRGRAGRRRRRRSAAFRLEVGRPIRADARLDRRPTSTAALEKTEPGGGRVEARRHRGSRSTATATTSRSSPRTLDDITARAAGDRRGGARAAGARRSCSTARRSRCAPTAGPHPFQVTGGRARPGARCQLTPMFFDVLHLDGEDRARPRRAPRARDAARARSCPTALRVPRRGRRRRGRRAAQCSRRRSRAWATRA